MCLFLVSLIHDTVAPAFISDSTHSCYGSFPAHAGLPHTNEYLCDHVVITITLTADLLSPSRDEIAYDVIIAQFRTRYVKVTVKFGNTITVQSVINSRTTVSSIEVLFQGIKASIRLSFALAHSLGILPTLSTVRVAFMTDFTQNFFVLQFKMYKYVDI